MSSKLAADGRTVVVVNPTEPHLPPGRTFRVVPLDASQEPKARRAHDARKPNRRGGP